MVSIVQAVPEGARDGRTYGLAVMVEFAIGIFRGWTTISAQAHLAMSWWADVSMERIASVVLVPFATGAAPVEPW